jgi:phytanoyl-CoA hydroxylase
MADEGDYGRDGYTVVRGAIPPDVVARLRATVDRLVESSRTVSGDHALFDLEPGHAADDPRVRRLKQPELHDEGFFELARRANVLDAIEALIGHDIRFQSGKLNMKSPRFGSPVEWHQDFAFYPHTNDDLLAVGIALDDATVENGCLLVVPGSHRGPVLDHHDDDGRFVGAVDPALVDGAQAVPIELAAGDISLHHVRLLHASAPNHSGRPRRLLLNMYAAADAFPLAALPGAACDTLAALDASIVRGRSTRTARCTELLAPIPNITAAPGSIYALQESAARASFDDVAR